MNILKSIGGSKHKPIRILWGLFIYLPAIILIILFIQMPALIVLPIASGLKAAYARFIDDSQLYLYEHKSLSIKIIKHIAGNYKG